MQTLHLLFPSRARPLRAESVSVRIRTTKNVLTVFLFLVAIGYPLYGFLFNEAVVSENENRLLNPPPLPLTWEKWTWVVFPPYFEMYLGDRIGGRAELLSLRSRVLIDGLGDNPTRNVWIGKDGWLFFNTVESIASSELRHPDLSEAVFLWTDELAARHRWCEERGIRYVVVVCPDKQSIYPEYLDDEHQRHPPPKPLPLLFSKLSGANVRVVDLAPPLLAAKSVHSEPLYFRLDTHWNPHGILVGYREVAGAVAEVVPRFPVRPPGWFVRSPTVSKIGDIAQMAGLPRERQVEAVFAYHPGSTAYPVAESGAASVSTAAGQEARPLPHIPTLLRKGNPHGPRVVCLHDSFGENLTPLLAPDCSRLVSFGTYGFPSGLIESEKPAVVIQEMVERTLWNATFIESCRR